MRPSSRSRNCKEKKCINEHKKEVDVYLKGEKGTEQQQQQRVVVVVVSYRLKLFSENLGNARNSRGVNMKLDVGVCGSFGASGRNRHG